MTTTNKEMDKLDLMFTYKRDTRNATLFEEELGEFEFSDRSFAVGSLYVRQQALELIGSPKKLKVTIEPVE